MTIKSMIYKIIKKNNNLKQAIIIAIILHVILFIMLNWNVFLNKEYYTAETLKNNDKDLPFSIVKIMNPYIAVQNYNRQQQKKENIRHFKIQKKNVVTENTVVHKKTVTKRKIVEKATVVKKPIMKNFSNNFDDNHLRKISSNKKLEEKDSTEVVSTSNNSTNEGISNYAREIKAAIENHFYDSSFYSGKICTLEIKLSQDGILIDVQSRNGDPSLCAAALSAAKKAKIPKPPSKEVYEVFKNISIDFKP